MKFICEFHSVTNSDKRALDGTHKRPMFANNVVKLNLHLWMPGNNVPIRQFSFVFQDSYSDEHHLPFLTCNPNLFVFGIKLVQFWNCVGSYVINMVFKRYTVCVFAINEYLNTLCSRTKSSKYMYVRWLYMNIHFRLPIEKNNSCIGIKAAVSSILQLIRNPICARI